MADGIKIPQPFQDEACEACVAALMTHGVAFLEAPTGAGKTGLMALVWLRYSEAFQKLHGRAPRVLMLTHRRRLLGQAAGPPGGRGADGLPGEIEQWTGFRPGRIAAAEDGGIDQAPQFVVGMVQSAQAHVGALEPYDAVLIDEAHHAKDRGPAEPGEELDPEDLAAVAGAYDAVLRRLEALHAGLTGPKQPRLALLGASGTPYQADEVGLDARFDGAPVHTVTYREAIDAGRIVPPETIRPEYRLKDLSTVEQLVRRMAGTEGLPEGVGAELGKLRPGDFPRVVAKGLARHGRPGKTLVFCDSIKEMDAIVAELRAQDVRAGKVSSAPEDRRDNGNARTLDRYELAPDDPDALDVVVSVGMIGEGYNVPATDNVVITNRCTTRSWYAQLCGRALRVDAEGRKTTARIIDFGATTWVWGKLEDQIRTQHLQVTADRAQGEITAFAAVRQVWAEAPGRSDIMVLPGAERTLFAHLQTDGTAAVYTRARSDGRDSRQRTAGLDFRRIDAEGRHEPKAVWTVAQLAAVTARELRAGFGWHAVMRAEVAETPGPDGAPRSRWAARAEAEFAAVREPLEREAGVNDRRCEIRRANAVAPATPDAQEGPEKRDARMRGLVADAARGDYSAADRASAFLGRIAERNAPRVAGPEILRLAGLAMQGLAQDGGPALTRGASFAALAGAARLGELGRQGLRRAGLGRVAGYLGSAGAALRELRDGLAAAGLGARADLAGVVAGQCERLRPAVEAARAAEAEAARKPERDGRGGHAAE